MLKFMRNKVISVDRTGPGELTVYGRLDDDLYGLDMKAVFSQDELEIQSIDGRWFRYTTPECPARAGQTATCGGHAPRTRFSGRRRQGYRPRSVPAFLPTC